MFGGCLYHFENKNTSVWDNIIYMFDRTSHIFKWSGLPETIPQRVLEMYLQLNGNACFAKVNDTLYIFVGGRGGEPDVYYMPTLYTIANPALNYNAQLRIGIDCVVMPNDTLYRGLFPLFSKYATMQAETELSLQMANIMSRMPAIITADTDNARIAGEKYIKDIISGKLGIYPKESLITSVGTHPIAQASAHTLTDLIEVVQYVKASWFNDIGLNAQFNMKRENLNSAEIDMNEHAIFTLVEDMRKCRVEFAEQVNKMFNTSISVEYSELWSDEYSTDTDNTPGENGGEDNEILPGE